jgi:hypothetical protein
MGHSLGFKRCLLYHSTAPRVPNLFAFEWEGPFMRERQQYTWTVLPQGFWDSPHLFSRALGKDLRDLQIKEGGLLKYVDALLNCSWTQDIYNANTILVLNFLADREYKISKNKAQISLQEVCYLGYILTHGAQSLFAERKEAICTLGIPLTNHQLHSFLGVAGFCCIWTPNFEVIARLYTFI